MQPREHVDEAQEFLAEADRKFEAGRGLQGSEMLWGAAAHMVIALAQQRGWPYRNHNAMKNAAKQLADEQDNPILGDDFEIAEKFHRNFYHSNMTGPEVNSDRPRVRRFVQRMRALLGPA